ncbi:monooxygenase [Apiospora phragmitis]|uniref:Monooxygenase n=1 Tax=Apiospora phragmitis TaxID=2905665 RepID=A0ABR1T349_9PEZI
MSGKSTKPFRAIVVGGGLVGLTAAHILTKAGIDFIVLEKHKSILTSRGTQLAIWPQTFRTFDQLGLLETLQPILDWCKRTIVLSAENACVRGRTVCWSLWRNSKYHSKCNVYNTEADSYSRFGYAVKFTQRHQLIKFLFDSLPETAQASILLGKAMEKITSSEDGVTVACDDGTRHEGSIVIGADGVHSKVRLLTRATRFAVEPEELSQDQKTPFTTTYRLYFADLPMLPGLAPNTKYDANHDGMCAQIVYGKDSGAFGLYEKLEKPTCTPKRYYTEEDKEAMLKRWGQLYIAPGRTISDVDSFRLGDTGMINLEEGLIDDWYWKRTVLVGDSVRKLEPHAGLGYNCGVTDLVVLVNKMRKLLLEDKSPGSPSLEDLFHSYQADRAEDTLAMSDTSMKAIRMLAWPDWKYRVIAKYVIPYLPVSSMAVKSIIGPLVAGSPVLEWLKEGALPASMVQWKHHPSV